MDQAPISTNGPPSNTGRLVLKNTLLLVASQALGMPLSILINALMARHLGVEDFGYSYLVTTYANFGFLLVEWGQDGALPALVARARQRSGEFLGSALAWRVLTSFFVSGVLIGITSVLGYDPDFPLFMALGCLWFAIKSLLNACQEAVRGLERMDVAAVSYVAFQLVLVGLVVPTLLLGGKLSAVLVAHAAACFVVLVFVWRYLRPVGIGPLGVTKSGVRELFMLGGPFLMFSIAMVLQPNVDAFFLSRLAPPEPVGWYAVARRLIGVILFPASALIGALYPTLCRLYSENQKAFLDMSRSAIRGSAVLVVPIAVACAAYPDVGISIFGRESFEPAEDDLRILSVFVFLVYFSMPLGCCILAAGRQRIWALIQGVCVVVSAGLDPLLVPWFQERAGNGGLGICVSTVASEVLMVGAGLWLTPKGVFDRSFLKSALKVLLSGAAMLGAVWALKGINPFVSAPIALLSYGLCLWAVGGIDKDQVEILRGYIGRKLRRQ